MSPLFLVILRLLHSSGVPIVVCGDQVLIGAGAQCNVTPPPPPPEPPPGKTHNNVSDDPISISNGF